MRQKKYTFSFTSVAAAIPESTLIAGLYLELSDWNAVRNSVIDANLLQTRTVSHAERLYREIAGRLKVLSEPELILLTHGTKEEQKQLIWVAICLRYPAVKDFAGEILVEQYGRGSEQLLPEEFDRFYLRKLEFHPELEALSAATIGKAGRVLFRMLKECGLLSQDGENRLLSQVLSPDFLSAIKHDEEKLALFPKGVG